MLQQSTVVTRSAWSLLMAVFVLLPAGCGGYLGDAAGGSSQGDRECRNYPSDDIEFIVPFSAGGGFDTWARMMGPFIEDYLPNDVNVTVRNLPGGGGMRAYNTMQSANPDGTQIMIASMQTQASEQVLGKLPFDLLEFTYLAQVTNDPVIFFVRPDSDIETIQDVKDLSETRTVRHADEQAEAGIPGTLTYAAYDITNYQTVLHEGSPELKLSIARGDTDVAWKSVASTAEEMRAGELKPILFVGDEKPQQGEPGHEELTEVETTTESGHPELANAVTLRRIILTAPGTPDCIAGTLEEAITKTLHDERFQDQAKQADRVIVAADGKQTRQFVQDTIDVLGQYEQVLSEGRR